MRVDRRPILLALVLCSLAWFSSIQQSEAKPKEPPQNFSLPDASGKIFKLDSFKGQVVLVNFWATWCPPCIQELPSMDELNQRFKGKAFTMIAISVDQSDEDVKKFLASLNRPPSFLILRDPKASVAKAWGTDRYPESYLLDKKTQIVEKFIGATNWTSKNLQKRIRDLIERKLE